VGCEALPLVRAAPVASSHEEDVKRDRDWYVGYFWGVVAIGTLPLWFPIFLLTVYSIPVWRWRS